MNFRVGQKVVCVNDDAAFGPGKHLEITKGDVYTVVAVGLTHVLDKNGLACLSFAEVPYKHAFWAHRFRPIVERKTDITVFTEILRKATKPARSPAMSLHNRA